MKWLSVELIHAHCRIDIPYEDDLLELYGNAAEETVLNVCNRSYEDIMETYGDVPAALTQAALLLVDNSFEHRSPSSVQNLYSIPYSFDVLVKPYMRLTFTTASSNGGCKNF